MIRGHNERLLKSEGFSRLAALVSATEPERPLLFDGAAGSLLAYVASVIYEKRNAQLLLITSSIEKAEMIRDDCATLIGEANVRYLGRRPTHEAETLDVDSTVAQVEALRALVTGRAIVIVASPQSIVAPVPLPARFSENLIDLPVKSEYGFARLHNELERLGFEKKDFVEGYGDYSIRGGIIDVFPYIGSNPIRIEFWGDTIESIREFDILSQRSIKELQVATLVPDVGGLSAEREVVGKAGMVFDYLQADAFVILDEPEIVQKEIEELREEGVERILDWEEAERRMRRFPRAVHSVLGTSWHDAADGGLRIDFGAVRQPAINGSIKALVSEMDRLTREGIQVFLTCDTPAEADRLKELIWEEYARLSTEIEKRPQLQILSETLHSGFLFPAARLAVFTEHEIFGRIRRRGRVVRRRFRGFSAKELQQLRRGDFVVHVDYGIGRFSGLQKIKVGGAEQEAMRIHYLDDDVLYVNLNYIDRVQKYSSQEGHVPKLSKLGGADWERLKSKAKRRIKDIARDLIRLYARRKLDKGFAFSPDSHWQKELEASFIYEDTPDQERATLEVKRDMESEAPMDRLICGDVGFGKTEVAVRAAFKAALDGRQTAVLVPTTILAEQHYRTFLDRLERYTVRVEFLSRFKTKKQQAAILGALAAGAIDIVIGTHRLLSKDVKFKDLGLLIVDEEHRFGVAAKEKLRQLKASVDTMTLTATPIPRTLQFSLLGSRDISLINTPPRNRLPIITEIAPYDWKIIRAAVLRELHRGGQVFFVHDRVHNIGQILQLLTQHLPGVRSAIAHGQMPDRQLEQVIVDFLERKYDVLISTKIIESGIDMPNVNTIIVNRSDNFGLAELYQLRGRVGRSNLQAYAYLLTPPFSVLPKKTLRRLQAIEEFTELGSGFNLAMRDLEIRGAGNLLGTEQSGFIVEMGFEMYERVMKEAVEELRNEEFTEVLPETAPRAEPPGVQTIIDSDIDAYIPDIYLEADAERLDIYRRLSRAVDPEQIEGIRTELRDRFGEYPEEVENLCLTVELRLAAMKAGIRKLTLRESRLTLLLPSADEAWFYDSTDSQRSRFQRMIDDLAKMPDLHYRLQQEGNDLSVHLAAKLPPNGTERLKTARKIVLGLAQ
jgi:transcription-repair coupling factor (superfamily II helicase)